MKPPLCRLCGAEHWTREGCKVVTVNPSGRQAVRAAERAKTALVTDASASVPLAPKTAEAIRSARYRARHQEEIARARNRNRMRVARAQSEQAKRAHAQRGKRAAEPNNDANV